MSVPHEAPPDEGGAESPSTPEAVSSADDRSAAAPTAASAEGKLPWIWIAVLAVGPVGFAAWQLGRWHPDEVYQYLEPAWFRVHHFGILAWEWKVGLRNWAAPIVISWFIRLAEALGVHDPRGLRAVIALPVLALHIGLLVAAFRYVERRFGSGGWPTHVAWLLVAAMGPVLLFSGRTMGETFSTAMLVMAVERLDRTQQAKTRALIVDGLLGGALLGFSVVVRYGSAVFVLAALAWLLATRRFRMLALSCAGGVVIALGLGLLDWKTWGEPFHSMRAYVEFNLLSGHAEQQFGEQPWWFYLPFVGYWVGVWAWPGTLASLLREKRVPLPTVMAIVYVLAISLTPHKEARFLYPAVVLFVLGAAPGLIGFVRDRVHSTKGRGQLAAAAVLTGMLFFFGAPDLRGDEFRAYVKATRSPEATGILVSGEGIWGSGGYFYLGRNIPFYNADLPQHAVGLLRRDRRVNRVIVSHGLQDGKTEAAIEAQGFALTDRVGRWGIYERQR